MNAIGQITQLLHHMVREAGIEDMPKVNITFDNISDLHRFHGKLCSDLSGMQQFIISREVQPDGDDKIRFSNRITYHGIDVAWSVVK